MNKLDGSIKTIQSSGDLLKIEVKVMEYSFHLFILKNEPSEWIPEPDATVTLLFKETEVILSKNDSTHSIENSIPCHIRHLHFGKLLTEVELAYGKHRLFSLISTTSAQKLELREGDAITANIASHSIMLSY